MNLNKGEKVYFTRILYKTRVCDLIELHVVNPSGIDIKGNKYFTACNPIDKHTLCFEEHDLGKVVFKTRKEAIEKIDEAEEVMSTLSKLHTTNEE